MMWFKTRPVSIFMSTSSTDIEYPKFRDSCIVKCFTKVRVTNQCSHKHIGNSEQN